MRPCADRYICPTRVELGAAAAGAVLIAGRLVEERQWLALDILVALAAAYVVVRPSVRAAGAYVVGALAVFGAVEGVLDARWNGLALRQVPAFLLAPAGIALVAAGIVALRSKSRVAGARRVGRWALTALATLLLAYLFVVSTASALWLTGKPRVAVGTFAVPHEDVTMRTSDGVRLAAWYVPPRNGAAIVLVQGGGGDRDGLKLHATMLAHHGYGVLLYDERGRGSSGGRSNGFGWDWPRDVTTAVDFLERRGVDRIGVLGLSTGAEVAITAAASDSRISAVVADGAEARTLDDFAHLRGLDRVVSLPYWAVTTTAVRIIRDTRPAPPLDREVARIRPRALLLVESNEAAEKSLAPVWARVDGRPGVLWHVDAPHTKGLALHPRAYERHVLRVFDRALLAPAPARVDASSPAAVELR